jgi:hypothetical protein
MMAVVAMWKQLPWNVLESLTTVCEAALRGVEAPFRLPASDQTSQAVACVLVSQPERFTSLW